MYSDGPALRRAYEAGHHDGRVAEGGIAAHEFVVRLVATDGALHRLLPEWWGLWERAGASPFASPAWTAAWWRMAADADLFCLAVRRHGELVALAPLRRTVGPAGHHLAFLASGPGERDLLIDPRFAPSSLAALAGALGQYAELWDDLVLDGLPADAFALRLPLGSGQGGSVTEAGRYSAMPASDGASLLAGEVVALADETVIRLVEALGGDEDSEPDLRPFLLQALPGLRAAGLAGLSGVAVDGRVRAAQFGVLGRDRYHLVRTGGDRRLAVREARRHAAAAGRTLVVDERAPSAGADADGPAVRRFTRTVPSGL